MKESKPLNKRIKGVIFDMDNTLVETDPYYHQAMDEIGKIIAKVINNGRKKKLNEEYISDRLKEININNYLKDLKPRLMTDKYKEAINIFSEENDIKGKRKELEELIETFFSDFYDKSPKAYFSTPRILDMVTNNLKLKISVYSHAQEEWTKIKIEYLQNLIKDKYNKEVLIPFVTTPIELEKDIKGWTRASDKIGLDISKCLVVGDNWNADILASVYAGCKNLVWINSKGYITKERMDEITFISKKAKAMVYVVRNISGLSKLLK